MSYQFQNVGTQISVTASVDGDAVVVELTVEESQFNDAKADPEADDEFVPMGTKRSPPR